MRTRASGDTAVGQVDRRRDDPLWRQIVAVLQAEIVADGRVPDMPLPSEAELSRRFGVSRNVIRQALGELERRQLIYRVKGQGTFVAPVDTSLSYLGTTTGSDDDLRAAGRSTTTKVLSLGMAPASPPVARDLRVSVGAPVVALRRLRRADSAAVLLVDTQLPAALVPELETRNLDDQSLYDVLRRSYGLVVAGADRWIQAVNPTSEEALLLEIDPATPILQIESIAWDAEGRRFERYRALHHSAHTRFYVGVR